jgi:hypothetical protein
LKDLESTADWPAINAGRYVINSIEYVDPSPPLKSTLFDDREELDTIWKLTLGSIRRGTEDGDVEPPARVESSEGRGGKSGRRRLPRRLRRR